MKRSKFNTRRFWKKEWIYGNSVERYYNIIKKKDSIFMPYYAAGKRDLLKKAVKTMHLDNTITLEQRDSLLAMINSPDDENLLVALYTIQNFKPKLFTKN